MSNTVTKKQKITVIVDTYNDRQTGQEKKKRRQVGEVTHWSDGGMSIEMWGPTGVQKLSVFDYDQPDASQPQQGYQQQPQQQPQQGYQQQPQQQPQQGYQPPAQPAMNQQQPNPQAPSNAFDNMNDDIPF